MRCPYPNCGHRLQCVDSRSHHDNITTRKYKCPSCNSVFRSKEYLVEVNNHDISPNIPLSPNEVTRLKRQILKNVEQTLFPSNPTVEHYSKTK